MTTPRTAAGRALLEALPRFFKAHAYWRDFEPSAPDRILAIEAEAAAQAREDGIKVGFTMGRDEPTALLRAAHEALNPHPEDYEVWRAIDRYLEAK